MEKSQNDPNFVKKKIVFVRVFFSNSKNDKLVKTFNKISNYIKKENFDQKRSVTN